MVKRKNDIKQKSKQTIHKCNKLEANKPPRENR